MTATEVHRTFFLKELAFTVWSPVCQSHREEAASVLGDVFQWHWKRYVCSWDTEGSGWRFCHGSTERLTGIHVRIQLHQFWNALAAHGRDPRVQNTAHW